MYRGEQKQPLGCDRNAPAPDDCPGDKQDNPGVKSKLRGHCPKLPPGMNKQRDPNFCQISKVLKRQEEFSFSPKEKRKNCVLLDSLKFKMWA